MADGKLSAAKDAALATTHAVAGARAAGKAVSKARMPLVAGGAAAVGLAGGLAVLRRR
jgi:hypothetical protein